MLKKFHSSFLKASENLCGPIRWQRGLLDTDFTETGHDTVFVPVPRIILAG